MTDTLEQNYEKAGYHAQQSWGTRPALVLVDFAQAYFDPEAPLFGGEGCAAARDHAITLAEAARAVGVPVIFTEVKYHPGGGDGGAFYAKVPALSCFDAGRDTQRLVDGLPTWWPIQLARGEKTVRSVPRSSWSRICAPSRLSRI